MSGQVRRASVKCEHLDNAIRALHAERHMWQQSKRLGRPYAEKRLAFVLEWLDVLECADAFLRGEDWTEDRTPGYVRAEAEKAS